VNFNTSAFTTDPNWEAARATWYGAPTGAGPDDDGTCIYMNAGGAWRRRVRWSCSSICYACNGVLDVRDL
jgi:hypothetical protein